MQAILDNTKKFLTHKFHPCTSYKSNISEALAAHKLKHGQFPRAIVVAPAVYGLVRKYLNESDATQDITVLIDSIHPSVVKTEVSQ